MILLRCTFAGGKGVGDVRRVQGLLLGRLDLSMASRLLPRAVGPFSLQPVFKSCVHVKKFDQREAGK